MAAARSAELSAEASARGKALAKKGAKKGELALERAVEVTKEHSAEVLQTARERGAEALVAARERGAEALLSALETEPGKRLAETPAGGALKSKLNARKRRRKKLLLLLIVNAGGVVVFSQVRQRRAAAQAQASQAPAAPAPTEVAASTQAETVPPRRRVRPTGKRAPRRRPELTPAREFVLSEYEKGVNTGKRPVKSPRKGVCRGNAQPFPRFYCRGGAGKPAFGRWRAGAGPPASAAPVGVTLAGNQFLLDGQPFVPRGFNSIALLNSAWCTTTATATAAAALTPTELQLVTTTWNANTLRFQVSQPVLAGPNGMAYAQQIETAVNAVLSSGFVVDISMQDQSRACGPGEPLPGPETEAAWSTLISNTGLSHDPAVMFELFNEPTNQPLSTAATSKTQYTWPDWLIGGRLIGPGKGWAAYVPIGHQDLVNYLRNVLNVPNILIADGAQKGGSLQGIPLLQDPGGAQQIAYAAHPYVYTDGPTGWDTRWGYLTADNAVIATEWSYTSSGCSKPQQYLAPQLLAYLRSVNIGVLGHALDDYAGGLLSDGALTPTQCGTAHPGSGQDFLQDYMATFPAAVVDAPPPVAVCRRPRPPASRSPTGRARSTSRGQRLRIRTVPLRRTTCIATEFGSPRRCRPASPIPGSSPAPRTRTRSMPWTPPKVGPLSGSLVARAPDSQPPTTPTGLKGTLAATSITLSWTASTDNVGVTGYRVLRNGVSLGTTTAKSYLDPAVTQGSSYSYQVVALDAVGNASAPAAKTIVFPDTTKPAAPTGLTLTPGSKSITLKWAAASDNVRVKSYRIYRFSTLIATVASPGLTYTNTGLTTGTAYSYHLTALTQPAMGVRQAPPCRRRRSSRRTTPVWWSRGESNP